MPKMIQLRHVPDDLHRKLKARAAMAGMSLSDYLLEELREIGGRPTLSEMLARLAKQPRLNLKPSPTQIIREERDSR